jgi:imidazolonepropionase-like amidohydrolase
MNRRVTALSALILLSSASLAAERSSRAEPAISTNFLVSHVRVFDGERSRDDMQVAVEGGIIRAVGPEVAGWSHVPVIDGTGATLLPGLIDAHAHVEKPEDLRDALRFGVTTVLDMGTLLIAPQEISRLRSIAAVKFDVADVRSAGFGAPAPGGHGTEYQGQSGIRVPTVADAAVADAYVSARRREGSEYLKLFINGVRATDRRMPNLDRQRVKALVTAAHSRGMLAVAHVENIDDVEIALDGGVDGLAHTWRRGGANLDIARRLATKKVFVIATLAVQDAIAGGHAALLRDSRLQPYLSRANKEQLTKSFAPPTTAVLDEAIAAVRSLHEAGVVLLAGTDASQITPTAHGVSLYRELEMLDRAGLSPLEALSAATMQTAKAFGLADRGRIAVGLKADLVLVRGDPTSNIMATRDVLRVWRSGVELDRRLTDSRSR